MEVPAHPLDSGLAETGSARTLAVNRLPTIPGVRGGSGSVRTLPSPDSNTKLINEHLPPLSGADAEWRGECWI